jgi:hypothetical protein
MDAKKAFEITERAHDLAKELMHEMILDGNSTPVVFATFLTGSAMCAVIEAMSKETFLEGCEAVYNDYKSNIERISDETH